MLFFSKILIRSFSTIIIFSRNLSKSLLFFRVSSFLIASFDLCKLSKIAKLSFSKLNEPNSNASFTSFSNLLLWFSISANDLSSLSSVDFNLSTVEGSFFSSFFPPKPSGHFSYFFYLLFVLASKFYIVNKY